MFMFDQPETINSIFFTKPRARILSCSLLSCRIETGLDYATTPRGMVTDNSELVLEADRMLFSSFSAEVCPGYTPPHDKQLLLLGIKFAPIHPYYLPSRTDAIGARLSCSWLPLLPLFQDLLPAWSGKAIVRRHSKKVPIHLDPLPSPAAEMRELLAHSKINIGRPRLTDLHKACLMFPGH